MTSTKILIVDDDATMRKLMQTQVAAISPEYVETAIDGRDAIVKLNQNAFNIVITDIMMPNMDGMELLKHIRTNFQEIDVIVITSYGDTFNYTEVIEAGASDFLKKPFRANELKAKINRVIREQRLISELKGLTATLERQVEEKTKSLAEVKQELLQSVDRIKQLQAQTIITKYGKPRPPIPPYRMKKKPKAGQADQTSEPVKDETPIPLPPEE